MLLQTVTPVSVLGTIVLFALFLSVTAHLAARNVLGDVDPRRALSTSARSPRLSASSGVLLASPRR